MTFKRTEKALADLTREELEEQKASATARRNEIAELKDDDLDRAALDEFDEIVAYIGEIDTTVQAIEAEEADLAARREALRSYQEPEDATEEEPDESGDDDGDEDSDNPDDVVIPDDASELEREPVTASARRGAAGKAARQAKTPTTDAEPQEPKDAPKVAMVAAANVPDFNSGQELESFRELAKAFASRSGAWRRTVSADEMEKQREVTRIGASAVQHGVGRIDKRAVATDFAIDSRASTAEQYDMVMAAANEKARFGRGGLVAAGGWCAPSTTIYDGFLELETVSGILDLPSVTADRGGINFTKGPDYASIFTTFGFLQTEAQAIAGTTKTCYDVTCPPFTEVRLDAIGFCITAGILTEAAYPELIDRVLQIGTVAHAHKVNASVISRILTYVGAAVDHAEIGATTSDVLQAAEIQALRLRYTYSMDPSETVEAFFPVWAVSIFRADLSRRTGIDLLAITQADVERYFSVRGVSVQWVYDWQPFTSTATGTWTSLPDLLEFVMYPAGSYVKLTTNVINLDAIYDSTNTKTNTYTAAFFEEGLAVANTGAAGVRVSIDVSKLQGQTGAANLGTAIP